MPERRWKEVGSGLREQGGLDSALKRMMGMDRRAERLVEGKLVVEELECILVVGESPK